MTVERKISKVFNLTDKNWMKHANPWSVATRYSVLPFLVLSIWSRAWIGWWCLVPIILSVLWMFFNPVFFAKPLSTKNWASKSVFGERVYLNRDKIAIPSSHRNGIYKILNVFSLIGVIVTIWALIVYSVVGAVIGTAFTLFAKSWYLDRMVLLYEAMKNKVDEYRDWEY